LAPAGGIDASVGEMARYAQLQVDNGTASERRVVSAEMMVELHRPEIAVGAHWPSTRLQSLHYSLGWFTGEDHGVHLVYHNGANPGFRATIVLVPSSKTGIVVLTNGESGLFTETAARSLLEQLLRQQHVGLSNLEEVREAAAPSHNRQNCGSGLAGRSKSITARED
jgi:CubicO group peptidase (beta-lactamase class C family)